MYWVILSAFVMVSRWSVLNDLHFARKPRPRSSSARPAMLLVNQERLVLKFPGNNNTPTSKIRQASLQLFRPSYADGILPYRAALLVINSNASARAPSLKSVKKSLSSCDCLFVLIMFSDFLWSDLTLLSEIAACLKQMKIISTESTLAHCELSASVFMTNDNEF